jgi:hypothetical protein
MRNRVLVMSDGHTWETFSGDGAQYVLEPTEEAWGLLDECPDHLGSLQGRAHRQVRTGLPVSHRAPAVT